MPPQIEHLIVLMMENRSFDHMFGFLTINNPVVPDDRIDNLVGNPFPNPNVDGTEVLPTNDAVYAGDYRVDPGHHFPDVNIQLFGANPVPAGAQPTNKGFVQSYANQAGNDPKDAVTAARVMKCFAPENIPVLTTLAQQFAVCDRWFSSLPGPTLPNRAFAHASTSDGRVDMNPIYWSVPTIYEALASAGASSRVYCFDGNTLAFTFKNLFEGGTKYLGQYSDFLDDLDGDLPKYCFVEPRFNDSYDRANHQYWVATDQHPDNNVQDGENFIADVYEAVRSSKYWTKSLLLIVYDEHGGFMDHVPPPTGVPTPKAGQINPDTGFDFTRLGVRVPAVLISPFIQPGTIRHEQFEHASLSATARKLFAASIPPLSLRDAAARPFDDVLTLDQPQQDAPLRLTRHSPSVVNPNTHGIGPLSEYQWSQVQAAYQQDMLRSSDKRVLGHQVASTTVQDINTEQKAADYIRLVAASFGVKV